jgi:uncharacterized protein with von Willebrand factor type A (vWA) domain
MAYNPNRFTLDESGGVVKQPNIPPALRNRPDGSNPLEDVHAGPDATIETDGWTRHVIKQEVKAGGTFESAVAMNMSPIWPTLIREMFAEMYDPTLPAVDPTAGSAAEYVKAVRDKAHEVPGFADLAERCVADGFRTGMAVDTIAQAIAENLPPPPTTDPDDAQQRAEDAWAHADANPDDAAAVESAQQATEQATQAAAELAEAVQAIGDDARGGMRRALKTAVAQVAAQVAQEEARMIVGAAGWGRGRGNAIEVTGPRRALLDAMRNDATLARIVELAGRMREFAKHTRESKTRNVPEEVVDIETGGDWSRFVAAELVGLADEDLELYLMRRAVERGVFQYALEGNENAARGPIVFCLDESTSMRGARHEYAKAAAFCMAEIAGREKRAFTLLHFTSEVVRRDDYRPPAPMHVDSLIQMLTHFGNGGTNIGVALTEAARVVEAEDAMGKADVILLSDGADGFPEKALARCESAGARVHGISVGSHFPARLRDACDTYAHLPGRPTDDDFGALSSVFEV